MARVIHVHRESLGGIIPQTFSAKRVEEYSVTPKDDVEKVQPEVLVIGGIAIDLSCDYTPSYSTPPSSSPLSSGVSSSIPSLYTSNPSRITESLGGVANNVAHALHLSGTKTRLVSVVGDDIFGRWTIDQLEKHGADTSGLSISYEHSTARYVTINDSTGGLFVASADMQIISSMSADNLLNEIERSDARWVCIDGNLSAEATTAILRYCKKIGIKVIFEPTSTAKSTAIFNSPGILSCFPQIPTVYGAAPNLSELDAMYDCASNLNLFSTHLPWWNVIDSLQIESGFRNSLFALSNTTGTDLTSSGTLQKAINLVPYVPNLFIKLGKYGCLVVKLLAPDDPALKDRGRAAAMVVRKGRDGTGVGGISIAHYPAEKPKGKIVSVNGAGDTFLGVLIGGLVKGCDDMEEIIGRAQRAAVLTLECAEAVNPDIRNLL